MKLPPGSLWRSYLNVATLQGSTCEAVLRLYGRRWRQADGRLVLVANGGDLSCRMVRDGYALRWYRYWKRHRC